MIVIKKRLPNISGKKLIYSLLKYIGIIILIVAPFYIYKEVQIINGLDVSEAKNILRATYRQKSLFKVFFDAIRSFIDHNVLKIAFFSGNYYLHIALEICLGLIYLLLLFFALFNKAYFLIFFFIVLPQFLIWIFSCSYDLRNLAQALPFYGLGLGIGLENILLFKREFLAKKLNKIKNYIFILLIFVFLILISLKYTTSYLVNRQAYLNLKNYGKPFLNEALFEYHNSFGIKKKVLTDYSFDFILFLQNISNKHLSLIKNPNVNDEKIFSLYLETLEKEDIGYLLIPYNSIDLILNHIEKNIKAEKFKLIFSKDRYNFIKII